MGIKSTKEQLLLIIADTDNKVVALTGKWGTGKTHLFHEVRRDSTDVKFKNSLVVSLFGLRDLNQVKMKLLQRALPYANKNSKEWQGITKTFGAIKNVLVRVHGGFSAIDELALLATPQVLKDKFIVLDDIERKHANLSIDEVLGFIDEFTQNHGARFLLILNSDQLKDQELWRILTEKVVDQEVHLTTGPEEAFAIASQSLPPKVSDSICNAVQICDITNIRVIRKIIKSIVRILARHQDLPPVVLARVVPSATLLAAIHYKGIDGGPTADYVIATGSRYGEDDDTVTEEKKYNEKWDRLLSDLGIVSCDDFELLVSDSLNTGLVDLERVSTIIERYLAEQDSLHVRQEAQEFLRRMLWDHQSTDYQLLNHAKKLVKIAPKIDAAFASALSFHINDLPNGNLVADDLVNAWIANMPPSLELDPHEDIVFQQNLHPRIKQALEVNSARKQAAITVLDVCIRVSETKSWGAKEELVMRAATSKDFEDTIRDIQDLEVFQIFMRKMLGFTKDKSNYEKYFGSAMDNFVDACRQIVATPSTTRLPLIVGKLLSSAGL